MKVLRIFICLMFCLLLAGCDQAYHEINETSSPPEERLYNYRSNFMVQKEMVRALWEIRDAIKEQAK